MSLAPERLAIGIRRTSPRRARIRTTRSCGSAATRGSRNWQDGTVAFEQLGVEFPVGWSLNATNIVAQKYFRGHARHARRGSRRCAR